MGHPLAATVTHGGAYTELSVSLGYCALSNADLIEPERAKGRLIVNAGMTGWWLDMRADLASSGAPVGGAERMQPSPRHSGNGFPSIKL